jgi:glycyl-tRNA synthetase
MMMKVEIGATGNQPCYLRPETCQSIFLDFSRMFKTMRVSLPLGIAQAGCSFRNEIAPRNSLLRAREFGQMEIEIFFNPKKINDIARFQEIADYKLNLMTLKDKEPKTISCKEAVAKGIISAKLIAYYLAKAQQCWNKLGIPTEKMRFRQLADDEKAFYSKESWDFEVETDLGWVELIACNYRTDYDLGGHAKESKQDLKVKEEGDVQSFTPHVFELSAGIDRTFFVSLLLNYKKEKRGPEERIFLSLPKKIAPFFVGVFPLVKKDGLLEKGLELEKELSSFGFDVFFDESGSIGKRYARTDEIGVPFAITIDYDTMKDNTVTLRDRDSLQQKRVKVQELPELLWKISLDKTRF